MTKHLTRSQFEELARYEDGKPHVMTDRLGVAQPSRNLIRRDLVRHAGRGLGYAITPFGREVLAAARASLEVFDRSPEQRLAALAKANRIRGVRAAVKRGLKAGDMDPRRVIENPVAELSSMKVYDVLRALPLYGPVKARRAMRFCRVADSKTLGGLSDRQRKDLIDWIGR